MLLAAYLPADRRRALAFDVPLADRSDGSALFADISGFTALTAMLDLTLSARRGVEELVIHMNRAYDALIAEVDQAGGTVIGFSGDAITCWFAANDDQLESVARRAVGCALAMQQAVGKFANLQLTGGGHATLALKVAVTSGPTRRFLVGDPAIQYLEALAGAAVTRLATAEHLAHPRDVIIDAPTFERLADHLRIGEWREDDVTGERFGVALAMQAAVGALPAGDMPGLADFSQFLALNQQGERLRPWLLPLVYERLQSGLGEFVTELRPAVALFIRFGGIDYEVDQAGSQLDAYMRWVQQVLARYGGVLLDLTIGDKGSYLYAAFGAPIAHEDDDRRAVAAALALRTLPPELPFIQPPQIGISRGTMRAGTYGAASRRTYGVLGNEVNLAARLMQRADVGEILISRRVQQRIAALFVLEPLVPIAMKGLREPVPIFRVLRERRHVVQLAEPTYTLPMVGRAAELALAGAKLDLALSRHGQIVGVTGEAGLGKSRLVAEIIRMAQAHGLRGFGGACESYGTNTPYLVWQPIWRSFFDLHPDAPLRRQIRALEGVIDDLAPERMEALPLLGPLLGLPMPENDFAASLSPHDRKSVLEALLRECLQSAAREAAETHSGLLFVLEDLHWIDPTSHELLELVAQTIIDLPVLIVIAYRPPDRARLQEPRIEALTHFTPIVLGPLAADQAAQVIRTKLTQQLGDRRGPLPPTLIEQITTRAQGNPFYIEELLNYLHDRGIDPWDFTSEAISLPSSLHALVLSRIDQLSERQKATLKLASVIGRLFHVAWLRGAYPSLGQPATIRADLDELAKIDLTPLDTPEPELAYLFKHIVTQEVAYESMTVAARTRLHEQLARYLEGVDPERYVDLLAFHYGHSGLREQTLRYLERAAHKAQRDYANETALSYYRAALMLEERWQWRQTEVDTLHIVGQRDEQRIALEALAAMPDAPPFTVASLWGQYHEALGNYPEAQAAVERALQAAQVGGSMVDKARSLALLGLIARRQGDYARAKGWYTTALGLFPNETVSTNVEARVLAQSLNGLGIVQRQQGNFAEARASYERAGRVCASINDLRGQADSLNGLGVTAYYQRDLVAALAYHQQALRIRQTIGDRADQGTSLLNLAQVNCDSGMYSQAEQYYLAALTIQQAVGNRWEEVNVWNGLGVLHQELGDLTEAKRYLQRGLTLSQAIGDSAGQTYLLSNLGLAVRDEGDLALAEALLSEGLALAQQQDDTFQISFFLSYLASVSLRAGQFAQAAERAQGALTLRRTLGLEVRTTADLTTLAAAHLALGDPAQARDYTEQALTLLDACAGEGPEFPQADYFICAEVLAATHNHAAAASALQSAYRLVMARADHIADPELRRSFLERVPINAAIIQGSAAFRLLNSPTAA